MGMEEELLSIVVPVYNMELYIEKCIQSIQEQTYKNIEIIVVDDGSEDNSVQICRKLAAQDSRIVLLEMEHKGVVSARNAGINCATGDYITFVDSDDWIENDLYGQMINNIKDVDLLIAGRYVHTDITELKYQGIEKGTYSGKEAMEYIWVTPGITWYMYDKMFRTDMVKQIHESMNKTIHWCEDAIFIKKYLLSCQSIRISDIVGYHYCIRDNSAGLKIDTHCLSEIDKWYNCMLEVYDAHYYKEKLLASLSDDIIGMVSRALYSKLDLKKKDWLIYFPYFGRLDGKKVVLYGAGEVGQAYYTQIKEEHETELVLWVDKNYEKYQLEGMNVCAIENIKNIDYDFIIVAVWHEKMYLEIRKDLVQLGVDAQKILYNRTKRLILYYPDY